MANKSLVLVVSILMALVPSLYSAGWGYGDGENGPANWGKNYPLCNDTLSTSRQSPIDIDTKIAVYNNTLPTPTFVNYAEEHANTNYEIANNGHTLVVSPKYGAGVTKAEISFQGVSYQLAQFHFHWGASSDVGSEHTLNGKQFQNEVHFVHFNKKYQDVATAMVEDDGLLVFGNFIEATNAANHTGFQPILEEVGKVRNKDQTTQIPHFAPEKLLPAKTDKIFTYPGSLTTPGCQQSVRWIVNDDIIKISQWQMSQFLTLDANTTGTSDPIVDNFRPVQKLHERVILTNVQQESSAAISHASSTIVFVLLSVAMATLFR